MPQPLLTEAARQGAALHQVVVSVHCQLCCATTASLMRAALALLTVFIPAVLRSLIDQNGPMFEVLFSLHYLNVFISRYGLWTEVLVNYITIATFVVSLLEYMIFLNIHLITVFVRQVVQYMTQHMTHMLTRHLVRFSSVDPHFVQENARLLLELCRTMDTQSHLGPHLATSLPVLCNKTRYLCSYRLPGWRSLVPVLRYLFETRNKDVEMKLSTLPPFFRKVVDDPSAISDPRVKLHQQHQQMQAIYDRDTSKLCSEVKHILQLESVDAWALEHLLFLLSSKVEEHEALISSGMALKLSHLLTCLSDPSNQSRDVQMLSCQCLGLLNPWSLEYDLLTNEQHNKDYWSEWLISQPPATGGSTDTNATTDTSLVVAVAALTKRLLSSQVDLCQMSSQVLCSFMTYATITKILPQLSSKLTNQLKPLSLKR